MAAAQGFTASLIDPVLVQAARLFLYGGARSACRRSLGRSPRTAGTYLGNRRPRADGRPRGRELGFPTANIALGDLIEPAAGVYAVRVGVEDDHDVAWHPGVAYCGPRPTFDKAEVLLEAHLFDFAAISMAAICVWPWWSSSGPTCASTDLPRSSRRWTKTPAPRAGRSPIRVRRGRSVTIDYKVHRFPAAHRLPDESGPAGARAASCWSAGRRSACSNGCAPRARARKRFVLHDGPPYANGNIHLGTRAQQDPQGHRQPRPADAGQGRALRAGLGLPRPADRMEDRGAIPRGRARTRTKCRSSSCARNAAASPSIGSTCSAASSSGSA